MTRLFVTDILRRRIHYPNYKISQLSKFLISFTHSSNKVESSRAVEKMRLRLKFLNKFHVFETATASATLNEIFESASKIFSLKR